MLPQNADTLDFSQMKDCSHKEVTCFLFAESKALVNVIRERIFEAFCMTMKEPSASERNYCPDATRELILQMNERGYRNFLSVIFPALIYTATRYDTTISKLMYDWQMPVVPPRKLCGLLERYSELPERDRELIRMLLDADRLVTQNVPYILKTRMAELADEQRYLFPDILWFSTYSGNIPVTKIPDFAYSKIREDDLFMQHCDPQFLGTMQYFRMLLLLSYTYQVAPERLLLQDYSAQAVKEDGTPFTQEQQELLSMYLCATTRAQTMAVQEILVRHMQNSFS